MIERFELASHSPELLKSRASVVTFPNGIKRVTLAVNPSFDDAGNICLTNSTSQLDELYSSLDALLEKVGATHSDVVSEIYFAEHQELTPILIKERAESHHGYHQIDVPMLSMTGQKPAHPQQKVALEAIAFIGAKVSSVENSIGMTAKVIDLGDIKLIYMSGIRGENGFNDLGDLTSQSYWIFKNADQLLQKAGANFKDNCLRTWIYIHDIDNNYPEFNIRGRDPFFDECGITSPELYKPSTGIGTKSPYSNVYVMLDVLAAVRKDGSPIHGEELNDLTRMNRPPDYRKRFVRGRDYRGVLGALISGTASINDKGEVVYAGDLPKQADRMFGNIAALANNNLSGITRSRTYLRNPYQTEQEFLRDLKMIGETSAKYDIPLHPKVVVIGQVCRDKWRIETEADAFFR